MNHSVADMHARAIQSNLNSLEEVPFYILRDASAWEKVIIDNPVAILKVIYGSSWWANIFWGTPEAPSQQGLAVADALHAQRSDFLACLPNHVQENLFHRDMMSHPLRPNLPVVCPQAPIKRARTSYY
jgi:hypothetical protein